jgi:hypothetical protein
MKEFCKFKNLTAAAAHIAQYYQARAQNALNLVCFAARISLELRFKLLLLQDNTQYTRFVLQAVDVTHKTDRMKTELLTAFSRFTSFLFVSPQGGGWVSPPGRGSPWNHTATRVLRILKN